MEFVKKNPGQSNRWYAQNNGVVSIATFYRLMEREKKKKLLMEFVKENPGRSNRWYAQNNGLFSEKTYYRMYYNGLLGETTEKKETPTEQSDFSLPVYFSVPVDFYLINERDGYEYLYLKDYTSEINSVLERAGWSYVYDMDICYRRKPNGTIIHKTTISNKIDLDYLKLPDDLKNTMNAVVEEMRSDICDDNISIGLSDDGRSVEVRIMVAEPTEKKASEKQVGYISRNKYRFRCVDEWFEYELDRCSMSSIWLLVRWMKKYGWLMFRIIFLNENGKIIG